jgi:hypothetical protein
MIIAYLSNHDLCASPDCNDDIRYRQMSFSPVEDNADDGTEAGEVELANAVQSSSTNSSAPTSRTSAWLLWSSFGESMDRNSIVQRGPVPAWVFYLLHLSHFGLAGYLAIEFPFGAVLYHKSTGSSCDALLRDYSLFIAIMGIVGYVYILASTIGVSVVKCIESCCCRELPRRYTADSSEPVSSVGS